MNILSRILRHIAAWFAAVDQPAETMPTLICWADLPPHHPRCD